MGKRKRSKQSQEFVTCFALCSRSLKKSRVSKRPLGTCGAAWRLDSASETEENNEGVFEAATSKASAPPPRRQAEVRQAAVAEAKEAVKEDTSSEDWGGWRPEQKAQSLDTNVAACSVPVRQSVNKVGHAERAQGSVGACAPILDAA